MCFIKRSLLVFTIFALVSCGGGGGVTDTPNSSSTLANQAISTLHADLVILDTVTDEQVSQIIASVNQQLKESGLSEDDNATLVLPSLLEGVMEGIGTLALKDAQLINSLIEQSISSVMGLLATKPPTTRQLRRSNRSFTELQSLLELLVDKAVSSLEKTKLPIESLGTGVGKVVHAMVASLDKAQIENTEVSSAVDKVVGKSMQSLEKLPVVVWEGSVKHITEQAISGTGNLVARVSGIDLGESVGKVVNAVVTNLDKVQTGSVDVNSQVEQVIRKGMESLGSRPKESK